MNINLRVVLFSLFIFVQVNVSAQSPAIRRADSLFAAMNWKMATQSYEAAMKDSALTGLSMNRLGFSYYKLGMMTEAMNFYDRALETPLPPILKLTVLSRMAKVYALQNKPDLALDRLDSAVATGYANLSEIDTLSDFNLIRSTPRFVALQKRVYAAARPCMVDPHAREFDFWVGDWDVYQAVGRALVGHNKIEIIADGCGLLENWTNLGNQTGKSLNFIDITTNKWKQSWVGGGNQEFVNGEYKDSAMRFTFETTGATGNKLIGRFIFFNEGPDQVRQFNETSADDGKTWTTVYNFVYLRKKK